MSADLEADTPVALDPGQSHYLQTVLRLGPGALLRLFNGRDGEWLARVASFGKRGASALPERRIRAQPAPGEDRSGDCWLAFAPVKHVRVEYLIEKATELGVSALLPVRTERTQSQRLNLERLAHHAREAAEQSERLSVPELHPLQPLDTVLAHWPAGRRILLCDETGGAPPLASVLQAAILQAAQIQGVPPAVGGWAILIGPEGGWSPAELDRMANLRIVTRVGLGPLVLRAETAALAALAVFQAVRGSWRLAPEP